MNDPTWLRHLRSRRITKTYQHASIEDIVKDLLATDLRDLKLTLVSAPTVVIWRQVWDGVNAARAFSDLARQVGQTWEVNRRGELTFRLRTPEEEAEHRRQIAERSRPVALKGVA